MRPPTRTLLKVAALAAGSLVAAGLGVAPAGAAGAARAADTPLDGLVVSVQTNLVGPGGPRWTACPATAQGFVNDDAPVTVTTVAPPAAGTLTASRSALVTESFNSGALVGFALILPVKVADGSAAFIHVFQEHPSRGCLPLAETGTSPAGATYAFSWSLDSCNGCGAPVVLAAGTGCVALHPLGKGQTLYRPSRPEYKGMSQFGVTDVFSFGGCDATALPATTNPPPVIRIAGSVTGKGTLTSNVAPQTIAPDLVTLTCTTACTFPLTTGSAVRLTATPAPGYRLSGWSGACSGRRPTCTLTVTAAASVRVAFVRSA